MIRVLVVDDQALMRRGLRRMLEIEEGIAVAGEAGDGEHALSLVPETEPDVVLVDARMPGMGGVELIRRLTRDHPGVAALVLSTFDEDEYVHGALRGGARGYLLKDCSPDELVSAVRRAHAGETVLDGAVARRLAAPLRSSLSTREAEVARRVAAGESNGEIAERLHITEGTVKNHVSSALRKLGLRDRTQLAIHVHGGFPPGSAE